MQLLKIVYIELNLVNSNTDILIPTNLSDKIQSPKKLINLITFLINSKLLDHSFSTD